MKIIDPDPILKGLVIPSDKLLRQQRRYEELLKESLFR
jgi:hypothetical protein